MSDKANKNPSVEDMVVAFIRSNEGDSVAPSVTILDIVEWWMDNHDDEYDGLYSEECGCERDDLAPCGQMVFDCRAGHRQACDTCKHQEPHDDADYSQCPEGPRDGGWCIFAGREGGATMEKITLELNENTLWRWASARMSEDAAMRDSLYEDADAGVETRSVESGLGVIAMWWADGSVGFEFYPLESDAETVADAWVDERMREAEEDAVRAAREGGAT